MGNGKETAVLCLEIPLKVVEHGQELSSKPQKPVVAAIEWFAGYVRQIYDGETPDPMQPIVDAILALDCDNRVSVIGFLENQFTRFMQKTTDNIKPEEISRIVS